MEEPQSLPLDGDDRSAQTAEALRALRAKTDEILAEHRHRMTDMEAKLNLRLQQLTEVCQAECDELDEQLPAAQQAEEELPAQECEQRLQELEKTLGETEQALQESQASNGELSAQLQAAQQRVLELDNTQQHEEELGQINRKFELALADVRKLKRENGELHAELASRPAVSDAESPELVSLRTERDALAARVSELESAPQEVGDADLQQDLIDLQRRFELAVDEVRALKQENAELQQQLCANPPDSAEPAIDAFDWQVQKARLLAQLDAEDQANLEPSRREARATIEGTISITDQVVAEKDKQIAALQDSLESKPDEEQLEEIKQALREEVFGNDKMIVAERKRLEAVQQEWQEKLRKAELEISVERAKLARERSALEEKLATVQDPPQDANQNQDDKPRRRWMSALGLKDDDDEKKP